MASRDNRVGVWSDGSGGHDWPAVDINGRPYVRPPHGTASVGNRRFVVLPMNYRDDNGVLEELRSKYAPPARKTKTDDNGGGE